MSFDIKPSKVEDPKGTNDVVRVSDNAEVDSSDALTQDEISFRYNDSQKIGTTGAVFLILNKMIGTGIFSTPSGIFANTGSVGVCLFLWVIGSVTAHFNHAVGTHSVTLCSVESSLSVESASFLNLAWPFLVQEVRRTIWNACTGTRSFSPPVFCSPR